MPIGVLVAAGALVMPNATVAHAATASENATEEPATGEFAATAVVSDTEIAHASRLETVTVTERLTSKIRASGTASSRSIKNAKATRSVKVTSYGASSDQAMAAAKASARIAAKAAATKAAKAAAIAETTSAARAVARARARHRADVNVRAKFGSVVLARTAAQRGKPYRWGAQGPSAFDCSGLVRYVMKGVGVTNLPRTSQAMAGKAHRISKAARKPGDLIFFTSGSHVYHVAIYAGKNMIWHSPGSGRHVQKIKIWTSHYRVGRVPA
jgi:cell wall-associated NlpC family hydrolase